MNGLKVYRVDRGTNGYNLYGEGPPTPLSDPPGHEERILAHRRRVEADMARLGQSSAGRGELSMSDRLERLLERRGGCVRLAEARANLTVNRRALARMIAEEPERFAASDRSVWLAALPAPADETPGPAVPPTAKECPRCQRVLPLRAFGPDRRSRDGLKYACRPCLNAFVVRYRSRKKRGASC